jgi:hypothetical protein
MEIDITDFVRNADPFEFSRSIAEYGEDAGPSSWRNALAHRPPMLTTEAQLDALRHWAKETGAWDDEERAAWSDEECNALFVQLVSGDIREAEGAVGGWVGDWGDEEWREYEKLASDGMISGNLYGGCLLVDPSSDRIWYSLA